MSNGRKVKGFDGIEGLQAVHPSDEDDQRVGLLLTSIPSSYSVNSSPYVCAVVPCRRVLDGGHSPILNFRSS